jgi:hypothetical protein
MQHTGVEKWPRTRLTGNLKAARLTIYVRENPLKLITDFKLRADLNGDLEILDAFWDPKILVEEGRHCAATACLCGPDGDDRRSQPGSGKTNL